MHTGKLQLVEDLLHDPILSSQPAAKQGLEEMKKLLEYCNAFGVLDTVNQINTKVHAHSQVIAIITHVSRFCLTSALLEVLITTRELYLRQY